MIDRSSGVLMHISSLPGGYGIGDFGKAAYRFVDFVSKAKLKYWQILPLGVTGYGDSPYQCFSAFAGNPYFIDLDELIEQGYLDKEEILEANLCDNPERVDYGLLYNKKMPLLHKAYDRAYESIKDKLDEYYESQKRWLREFALFMAIKAKHNGASWQEWAKEYRKFDSEEVIRFEQDNQKDIHYWTFTQYFFDTQWQRLREYALSQGVKFIGDLPIYVSEDSSDLWANPKYFDLDSNLKPNTVSGCPPDGFSLEGQLWGNPIYDWESLERDGYSWWIRRIEHSFKLYDVLRIDHFRGFEAYWEIQNGAPNAVDGVWKEGPGFKLFRRIKEELGELDIIAEDLGFITKGVEELIEATGFPGMKMLQFAFDPEGESDYLPHKYSFNSTVYTGSHDSSTVNGWIVNMNPKELEYCREYLNIKDGDEYHWAFIRGAWSSVAKLAVAPISDFLGLDDSARMNVPAVLGGNWSYRVREEQLTDELAMQIADMNRIYRR